MTAIGLRHNFDGIRTPVEFAAHVPLAEYENFADAISAVRRGALFPLAAANVLLLEPTSGSSGAPKLIPYTTSLRQEFQAAIQPWIAWLYLAHPRLLLGRQYWAISPHTSPPNMEPASPHAVPVGFADDSEYLGAPGRFFTGHIMAAPRELRLVTDQDAFMQLTLFFLLREKNLRLISVWHPSFLTVLLNAVPTYLSPILHTLRTGKLSNEMTILPDIRKRLQGQVRQDIARAAELESLDLAARPENLLHVWPHLEIISCWTEGHATLWADKIRLLFPDSVIQAKGLLATEGVVTLTTGCGMLHPCAIRSHFLEFIDSNTGKAHPVWELELGKEYSVVLTTGGGLWRYQLHDRVRVAQFCHATPCLEFLGKDNAVSDLVGEKLDERHVTMAFGDAVAETSIRPVFVMLVPHVQEDRITSNRLASACGYLLLLELNGEPAGQESLAMRLTTAIEKGLCKNYHYAHARNLGQLRPLRHVFVQDGVTSYHAMRVHHGTQNGAIKIPSLDFANTGRWWEK